MVVVSVLSSGQASEHSPRVGAARCQMSVASE